MIEWFLFGLAVIVGTALFLTAVDLFKDGLVWLRDWVLDRLLGPEDDNEE